MSTATLITFQYFLFFWFVHVVGANLSYYLTKSYRTFDLHHKTGWNCRICAIVFPVLAAAAIYSQDHRLLHWIIGSGHEQSVWLFTLSYVLYDFSLLIVDRRALSVEMVAHHFIMLVMVMVEIFTRYDPAIAETLLLTEMSTPFLSLRWLLFQSDQEKTVLYAVNGGLFWLSFLIYRVLTVPTVIWYAWQNKDHVTFPIFEVLFCGSSILCIMNFYWFFLITGKLFEVFSNMKHQYSPRKMQPATSKNQ